MAANMGNRLTKATIDVAIESLKEEAGPVSESIIVAYMEAQTRTIGTKNARVTNQRHEQLHNLHMST